MGKATAFVHSKPHCRALDKGHVHQQCLHPGWPGPREQMAEDDICVWVQSISNARHCGSTGSLLSQTWAGGAGWGGDAGCLCLYRQRSLLFHQLKGPKGLSLLPGVKVSVITLLVPVHVWKVKACTWTLNQLSLQLSMEKRLGFSGSKGDFDH